MVRSLHSTAQGSTGPSLAREGQPSQRLERAIAQAAKELNDLRDNWLNPYQDQPAPIDVTLKKRTLTNLYNEHPTWLQLARVPVIPAGF